MINYNIIRKSVNKPMRKVIKEIIDDLLQAELHSLRYEEYLSINERTQVLRYLNMWIDLCCAYTSEIDSATIYHLSLDGFDSLRLEDAKHVLRDENAFQIYNEIIRPHPGRKAFIKLCRCAGIGNDLGYIQLLRDIYNDDPSRSYNKN